MDGPVALDARRPPPIVGPLPNLPACPVAVGPGGVTAAPALGRLVAAELAGDGPDPLLAPSRPGRFAARAAETLLELEAVFQDRDLWSRP